MRMRSRTSTALTIAAACGLAVACADATQIQLLEIPGSGSVAGQAYFDLDLNGVPSAGDSAMIGVTIQVVSSTSSIIVGNASTDTAGVFRIDEVPSGDYRVTFADGVLGDSLEQITIDSTITVVSGDTARTFVGSTFPVLSLPEVVTSPPGRSVFTTGIALNERVPFDSTGRVHITALGQSLRALLVDRGSVAPGDSVRLRGRVVSDNGRPALTDVTAEVLVASASVVVPVDVTTAVASTAQDTLLDAALARVRHAEISDTSTVANGDFHFWLDDGSNSVEVVVRSFLGVDNTQIRPNSTVRIAELTGLLSPTQDAGGSVAWQLLPRTGSDITLETRLADVQVTVSVDNTAASLGDTLTFTVVALNAGPLTATGVTITDSIPAQTTFVASTQTRGSYNDTDGLWTIGDLPVGAADTLQLTVEVSDGSPAQIGNLALAGELVFEVDPDGSNNGALVFVIIS